MNTEQFVYWLQGFCDSIDGTPSESQWNMVKDKVSALNEVEVVGGGFSSILDKRMISSHQDLREMIRTPENTPPLYAK